MRVQKRDRSCEKVREREETKELIYCIVWSHVVQ